MVHVLSENPVELAPGEAATLEIDLEEGQFIHAVVDQEGVDVVLEFRSLTSEQLAIPSIDSPYGRYGPEELLWIADQTGRFELRAVSTTQEDRGLVRLERLTIRPAADQDRDWVEADRAFRRGREYLKAAERAAQKANPEAVEKELMAAEEELTAALEVFERLGQERRVAECWDELAVRWEKAREPDLVVSFSHQAAAGFETLGDKRRRAIALVRSGYWLLVKATKSTSMSLSLEERAEVDLGRGLEVNREHPDAVRTVSRAAVLLGTIYRRRGDHEAALRMNELSLELSPRDESEAYANLLIAKAANLRSLHQYSRALALYRQGSESLLALPKRTSPRSHIDALAGAADMAVVLGDVEAALRLLDQAEGLARAVPGSGTTPVLLISRGRAAAKSQDWHQAAALFRAALSAAQELGESRAIAAAKVELGNALLMGGDSVASQEVLASAREDFRKIKDFSGEASCLAHQGKAQAMLGSLESAAHTLEQALDIVEGIRRNSSRSGIRQTYWAERQSYFETAIGIQVELFRRDNDHRALQGAVDLHEWRRARELKDRLLSPTESWANKASPESLAEEARIESRIVDLAVALKSGHASQAALDAEIAELDRVRGKQSHPVEVEASTKFSIASFAAEQLDPETLVLIYSLGDKQSWLFSLNPQEELSVYPLPPRTEIEPLVTEFLRSVRGESLIPDSQRRSAMGLWSLLLAPVAEQLGQTRLIIVPDGSLEMLPFAALVDPQNPTHYLVTSHEIAYLPSLSSLQLLRRNRRTRKPPGKSLVAFGDPDFRPPNSAQSSLGASSSSSGSEESKAARPSRFAEDFARGTRLVQLPHSRRETEAIGRWFEPDKAVLYLGADAKSSTFRALSGQELGTLHLATHSIVDPGRPELSALAFSIESGTESPSLVYAFEIARLSLPADLVCLSACETGTGRSLAGEGASTLIRAFLGAGATRVVGSTWPVGDRSTSQFMELFYRALFGDGLAPSAALRSAQLEMLKDPSTENPYAWAPFILQGDWRPLGSEKAND